METDKKREYIQNHLSQVNEPLLDDLYQKVAASVEDLLIEESEEDLLKGNTVSHQELKKEIENWRPTK